MEWKTRTRLWAIWTTFSLRSSLTGGWARLFQAAKKLSRAVPTWSLSTDPMMDSTSARAESTVVYASSLVNWLRRFLNRNSSWTLRIVSTLTPCPMEPQGMTCGLRALVMTCWRL